MNGTILLVEDDENDAFFMKRALKTAGVLNPVTVAPDGRRALQYLAGGGEFRDRCEHPLPCLVLLDLKLPYIMGFDVLRWIRDQPEFRTLVVVVFTASKLQPDIEKAYSMGANSYIVKPSSPSDLPEILKLTVAYWTQINQSGLSPAFDCHLVPGSDFPELVATF